MSGASPHRFGKAYTRGQGIGWLSELSKTEHVRLGGRCAVASDGFHVG